MDKGQISIFLIVGVIIFFVVFFIYTDTKHQEKKIEFCKSKGYEGAYIGKNICYKYEDGFLVKSNEFRLPSE